MILGKLILTCHYHYRVKDKATQKYLNIEQEFYLYFIKTNKQKVQQQLIVSLNVVENYPLQEPRKETEESENEKTFESEGSKKQKRK